MSNGLLGIRAICLTAWPRFQVPAPITRPTWLVSLKRFGIPTSTSTALLSLPMAEHFDVIIVGTGAGGGPLAHSLALAGKKILISSAVHSCRERSRTGTPPQCSSKTATTPRRVDRQARQGYPPWHRLLVGGNTKVYGAAAFRLREADFGEVHHEGGALAGVGGEVR